MSNPERAVDIVEDAGFAAVEAVNADEALSILESRSDISLLFSDIQMPGSMDGLKLACGFRRMRTVIPIDCGQRFRSIADSVPVIADSGSRRQL
jgi:CheY-like chemotaxis protein